jgi:hypothetical protein
MTCSSDADETSSSVNDSDREADRELFVGEAWE